MASQITHIVFSDLLYKDLSLKSDRGQFLAGNIFPDIRYMQVIDRHVTHPQINSLGDIADEVDPFEAGVKMHSLVDLVRQRDVDSSGIYDMCPRSKFATQTLKLFEDELYYDRITDWPSIIALLNPQPANYQVPPDKIEYWYSLLREYFTAPPSDESRKSVVMKIGFPADVADKMNADLIEIRANERIRSILNDFYGNITQIVKDFKNP